MWKIRTARASEAEKLSALAESTFRGTFGPFNSVEDMDLHCSRYFTAQAQAAELADPRMDTLLVEMEEPVEGKPDAVGPLVLVGYAQLKSGTAPACVSGAAPIELQRFYVVPRLQGGGLAGELMAAVLGGASERGADTLWLGVWEKNPRAIRFYGKYGFREVGDQIFRLGRDPQRDLVLSRPVILAEG